MEDNKMKVSDFNLLSELPEDYEYEVFSQPNESILVIGKNNQTIVGFIIHEGVINPLDFKLFGDKQCKN